MPKIKHLVKLVAIENKSDKACHHLNYKI